jgi:hypothetical protein
VLGKHTLSLRNGLVGPEARAWSNCVGLTKGPTISIFSVARGRDVVWRRRRLSVVPPVVRYCVLGRVFGFNHKIIINV